ncbi:MAG: hypothetical protein AB7K24_04225 [Gemmataceae bacterium]
MNYTVTYLPAAEQELTSLWLDSSRRSSVTRAVHLLDQELGRDPEQVGESRPDGTRIHFSSPLGVLFRFSSADRLVQVIHIWEFE